MTKLAQLLLGHRATTHLFCKIPDVQPLANFNTLITIHFTCWPEFNPLTTKPCYFNNQDVCLFQKFAKPNTIPKLKFGRWHWVCHIFAVLFCFFPLPSELLCDEFLPWWEMCACSYILCICAFCQNAWFYCAHTCNCKLMFWSHTFHTLFQNLSWSLILQEKQNLSG